MFSSLDALAPDPILGLIALANKDNNPRKVDLGVGVYKDESGLTPIMAAVKTAEFNCAEKELTKAYIGPAGPAEFNNGIRELIFGAQHPALQAGRVSTVLTPGGCGALRVGAEFLKRCNDNATVWVSDPTWANHLPLLGNAGLKLAEYPYYEAGSSTIKFDEMMSALANAGKGDIVLLHGCCHNPCGADLSEDQWQALTDLAAKNGFLPFIDLAYQGFGRGLDEDAFGPRLMAAQLPELLVASSCSKNFGLYRERVGSLSVLGDSSTQAEAALTHINNVVRGNYSMPPSHGGAIVGEILGDQALRQSWESELAAMRNRINQLRVLLVDKLSAQNVDADFSFIARQHGMFSFLGLSLAQVEQLREQYSIYMVGSSRVNIAGISQTNIDYVAQSIAAVLAR
ncbi:MAG: aspartate/tyrosine/aromatic aminotransferase [Gammaproteobacteria bacterium]|nr:aspartate/tyrosine/aromatic aminotransferase [Gammaproteobacteria bacterium]MBQ0839469.1 aspartate/tyrosine/aromatic aminotransferase [Gammaproteobacteria bacterium]